jgi:hypothetical protein
VHKLGAGVNTIDVQAATELGIALANMSGPTRSRWPMWSTNRLVVSLEGARPRQGLKALRKQWKATNADRNNS